MKIIYKLLLGSLVILALSSSSGLAEDKRPVVNERMRELQEVLEELYANAIKTRRLDTKEGIKQYGKSLHRFATLADSSRRTSSL